MVAWLIGWYGVKVHLPVCHGGCLRRDNSRYTVDWPDSPFNDQSNEEWMSKIIVHSAQGSGSVSVSKFVLPQIHCIMLLSNAICWEGQHVKNWLSNLANNWSDFVVVHQGSSHNWLLLTSPVAANPCQKSRTFAKLISYSPYMCFNSCLEVLVN